MEENPYSMRNVGLGVMEVLNAAYLSEIRGRKAVTIHELYDYIEVDKDKYYHDEDALVSDLTSFLQRRD